MTEQMQSVEVRRRSKWPLRLLIGVVFVAVACVVFIRTHPLIFNESFMEHRHCIVQAGLPMQNYASDNQGKFPASANGYGDALALLMDYGAPAYALTGPGYDPAVFETAATNGAHIAEVECGRVYVQSLSETNKPDIAILFDKMPTPGGDHCHLPRRLWAPLGREVWTVGSGHKFIKETDWPEFSRDQIELLVREGFSRTNAEALYAEKGKVR